MATIPELQVVEDLKEELDERFNIANGYEVDLLEIRFGEYTFDKFQEFPAIGYWMYSDEKVEEHMDDTRDRALNFYIYGYVEDSEVNFYEDMFKLAFSLKKFLMSEDWSYQLQTTIGDVVPYSTDDNGRPMFELTFNVRYYEDLNE